MRASALKMTSSLRNLAKIPCQLCAGIIPRATLDVFLPATKVSLESEKDPGKPAGS